MKPINLKYLALGALILFFSAITYNAARVARKKVDLDAATREVIRGAGDRALTVIHIPAGGCPVGWSTYISIFVEAGGESQSACVFVNLESNGTRIDFLRPGEKCYFGTVYDFPKTTPAKEDLRL